MKGFFSLNTAGDLREKLRRDLEKLKEHPLSVDAAFNFFVTAEHIVDWAYPAKEDQARRDDIRASCVLLRLCSHLANGAKHFEATQKRHDTADATSISVTRPGGLFAWKTAWATNYFPGSGGPIASSLVVNLKGDAAAEFGQAIGVVELAEKVMEYWAAQALPC